MSKKIRIGIFGVGFRGDGVGRGGSLISAVEAAGGEVVAICDQYQVHLDCCKEQCLKDRDVGMYTTFDEFIQHDMDAVMLCNYFAEHTPYAIKAMRAGKHVLSETTSNITMAEGVALVRAKEETGMTYGLLENYPYFKPNQEMERLARGGTLGKISYAEGEYVHPSDRYTENLLAPGKYHWRAWSPRTYYLTHSLAPLMQMTDAMPVRVTAMAAHEPDYVAGTSRQSADIAAVLLIQTDQDSVFRVTGCAGWAPHGNYYRLCGIKGGVDTDRTTGEVRLNYVPWAIPEGAQEHSTYDPAYPDEQVGELARNFGHGGGDFFAIYHFIRALENGVEPYWNVYRATAISSCAILAWRSILNGNMAFDIPDFRKEEDRRLYELDDTSPYPDEKGHVDFRCSWKPYAPSEADMEQARADWEKAGLYVEESQKY